MVEKLEVGKTYRWGTIGKDIFKCLSVATNGSGFAERIECPDAHRLGETIIIHHLKDWNEYVPPKTGKVWLNIHPPKSNWSDEVFYSKEHADRYGAGTDRIACVEVPWVEGQGL